MELQYNTQRSPISSTELGRSVQSLVNGLKDIQDKEQRSRMARTIYKVILNLNPSFKEIENYEQLIWDQIFHLADYDLDIECDFPVPTKEKYEEPLQPISYKKNLNKYRFYGQILIDMIDVATNMEDGEIKSLYINYLVSFMINSSAYWNDERITTEQAIDHVKELSDGKLVLSAEELTITYNEPKGRPNHRSNYNNKKRRFKKRRNGNV
jgi:hypothetical protein